MAEQKTFKSKARKPKARKPKARRPRGFRDIEAAGLIRRDRMLATIARVYESYGFAQLETPAFEYTDALGKFLPDQDRPNQGVFSLQDDDEQWVSLRYDLTAPLARFVAENYDALAKPYRRCQMGRVWRNEKPGPGRFREFMQFDADTVGAPTMAADAEMCAAMADVMEALGLPRGDYVVRVNNRKVLTGVLEAAGLGGESDPGRKLTILRALDKLDRLGAEGVRLLLGAGRKDDSGDFTDGAHLEPGQIDRLMAFVGSAADVGDRGAVCSRLTELVGESATGQEGVAELWEIDSLLTAAGFGADRVVIDPSVVRGLDYYTGPVFEIELTFTVTSEDGQPIRFGSVGGGGRYDDLVARFRGQPVPATGMSIGVDRLAAALEARGLAEETGAGGPVVVLVMDKDRLADYQAMTFELRRAGIRTEMYLGGSGMKAQVKYADKRGAPVAVIQGEDERAAGEVTLKDLILGAKMAADISDNKTWREDQPAQITVPRGRLAEGVRTILSRYGTASHD